MPRARILILIGLALMLTAPRPASARPHLTVEQEIRMGDEVAREVRSKYHGDWNDPAALARVRRIGERLVAVADRHQVALLRRHFHFELLNTSVANAMALPGGTVFVTRGLLRLHLDDDELAGVMGHEIAHAARRHGAIKAETSGFLTRLIDSHTRHRSLRLLGELGTFLYLHKRLDPRLETEADYYGQIYAARAGFDPDGLVRMLERFRQMEDRGGRLSRLISHLFDDHPPTSERIARCRATAKRLKEGAKLPTTPVPVYQ